MGAVYAAIDCRLQNMVAVKQRTVSSPDADRAFRREAELLAGLRHPALPVVVDYFVAANGQFLVMQYIEGEDLGRLLARELGPCSPDDVLDWALAILDALTYLHSHVPPVIHRDIKPANVKRTPSGEILLLDFGLAKGLPDQDATVAADEHSVFGYTPKYAPPEQIEQRGTDPRSDIYALGATLYHLATGAPPPAAADRAAAVRTGRPDPLIAPRAVNPAVPESLSQGIARSLELAPADRFASAGEMHAALLQQEVAARPTPAKPDRATDPRRVDAAMPSQAEVGRQVDLIVQVRFADSPLLGLEDWPTRRPPAQIEQGSEGLNVVYPVHPKTGALMPARIKIKIVAPDFTVEGQAEHQIEVPPNDYSKRLAFLLTPQRAGHCRVNVEVYEYALYLGTIPIEAEAVSVGTARPIQRVANFMLGMFVRERVLYDGAALQRAARAAESARIAAAAARAPVAAQIPEDQMMVASRADPRAALPPMPDGTLSSPSASHRSRSWLFISAAVVLAGIVLAPKLLERQPATPATQVAMGPTPFPAARPTTTASPRVEPMPAAPPEAVAEAVAPPAATRPRPPLPTASMPIPPEKAAVRSVIDAYARAYSALDFRALKRVWPAAPAVLGDEFAGLKSQVIHIGDETVVVAGTKAVVTLTWTATVEPRAGQPSSTAGFQTLQLEKSGNTWIIVDRR